MTPVWKGKIKDGKLWIDDNDAFNTSISSSKDRDIELLIRPPKKSRSTNQNKYYWGIVVKIFSDYWGYTPEESHDILLSELSKQRSITRAPDKIIRSSTMNTVEFEDYMARCRQYGAREHGLNIPMPNEYEN